MGTFQQLTGINIAAPTPAQRDKSPPNVSKQPPPRATSRRTLRESSPPESSDALVRHRRLGHTIRYESTVGAAVPVVAMLQGLVRQRDHIELIEGILSGTLGFIMSRIERGDKMGSAIREAVKRGYAEPDPRLDLGGLD